MAEALANARNKKHKNGELWKSGENQTVASVFGKFSANTR
jgi:hypothetical protein